MTDFKFQNGDRVKDTLTGFTGTITGRCDYMTGCRQYSVNPGKVDKDGKVVGSIWLDEGRLILTGGKKKKIDNGNPGGPALEGNAIAK